MTAPAPIRCPDPWLAEAIAAESLRKRGYRVLPPARLVVRAVGERGERRATCVVTEGEGGGP